MSAFATMRLSLVTFAILAGCESGEQAVRGMPVLVADQRHETTVTERILHRFGDGGKFDGLFPEAGLIDVDGRLFGTTAGGGVRQLGTVFKVTRAGTEGILHSFDGPPDGAEPEANLIAIDRKLYGTTVGGGGGFGCESFGCGAVFSMTRSGKDRVIYGFTGQHNGVGPAAGVIEANGRLFGTTPMGGAHALGTVFAVTRAGKETVLYSFTGKPDGHTPLASLLYFNGELYGTTHYGGKYNFGTVFAISQSGGERVVHSFTGKPDGAYPLAALIEVDGTLYGTTAAGGSVRSARCLAMQRGGCGTVFAVMPSGKERVVYSFTGPPDGAAPQASLLKLNGRLYGTTFTGGSHCRDDGTLGCGTVFSIDAFGKERVEYRFRGAPDGANPAASLIDVNGTLFGTTMHGGVHRDCRSYTGCGTVFSISP